MTPHPTSGRAREWFLWTTADGPPPLAALACAEGPVQLHSRRFAEILTCKQVARSTAARASSIQRHRQYWEGQFGLVDWRRQSMAAQGLFRCQHSDLLFRVTNRMIVSASRAAHWTGGSPACPHCGASAGTLRHMFAECAHAEPAWRWAAQLLRMPTSTLPRAERVLSAYPETNPLVCRALVLACRRAIWLETCRMHYTAGRPNAFSLVGQCAAELRADVSLDFLIAKQQAAMQTGLAAQTLMNDFWKRWSVLRSLIRTTTDGTRLVFQDLVGSRRCLSALRHSDPTYR